MGGSNYQRKTTKPICFSEGLADMWPRLEALREKTRISVSRQVAICVAACIDDLEKEMPRKRTFRLNNKEVTP